VDQLFRPKQVCGILGISRKTLARVMEAKALAYLRIRGSYRFKGSAVEAYLSAREVRASK
jgi:excisionase family DNA binding protein